MNESADSNEAVRYLRTHVSGAVTTDDSGDYDEARSVWNGMMDKRPLAVVRCGRDEDVVAAVEAARRWELPLAVRGGGHNVAGLATVEGGIVIDLSPMNVVEVDPDRRLAVVGGGALWRDVDAATQPFGLAAPSGLVSETGVAGLTLGGGLGWLRRAHGLSCDNLVAARLIDANGHRVETSAEENPELLWALRGGGGNFGVVTSFTFALHPVGPECAFALVLYDAADTRTVLRELRPYATTAPSPLAPIAFTGVVAEGMEGVPPEYAGRPMLALGCVYVGPPDEGEERLRPLRSWAEPMADLSGRLPWVTLQSLFDEEYPHGRRYYWKSAATADLSDQIIDIIVDFSQRMPSPLSTIDVWTMGGAIGNEPPGGSAYAGREAGFLVNPEANWDEPSADRANIDWARAFLSALQPFSVGTYLNFPGFLEEGEQQLRSSFGSKYERLVAVKERWDPQNLFRLNHNVLPRRREAA